METSFNGRYVGGEEGGDGRVEEVLVVVVVAGREEGRERGERERGREGERERGREGERERGREGEGG